MMRLISTATALILSAGVFTVQAHDAVKNANPFLVKRAEELCSRYDYIIVGGGMSGLVVANRLTEDPNVAVLVIEAGTTQGAEPEVLIPSNFISAPNGRTWNVTSQPQTELGGRTSEAQVAKVLGGGSAINGMLFDRAAKADYDAWEAMGNPGWNWDSLLNYFKKSETFHPPSEKIVKEFGIEYDPAAHGTSGPIHMSYPPFIYSSVKLFFDAMKQIGIPISKDGANGNALGAFWVASGVNPATQTRSYADPEYNDPIRGKRQNYHLILQNQVTRLLSDTSGARPRITGVEFGRDKNNLQTVFAAKDVIMSAGSIMTPKLLKLSGIGARSKLEALGINVLVDLPGVGENLQDHSSTFIYASLGVSLPFPQPSDLNSNATYQREMRELYETKQDGPYTNAAAQSLAFLAVEDFASDTDKAAIYAAADATPPSYFTGQPTLQAGWDLQLQVLRGLLKSKDAAAIELTTNIGTSSIGMERPFSRGYVDIASTDPWANPIMDFRAYSHPVDKKVAIASLRFYTSKILTAPAIAAYRPSLILPASNVQTDAQYEQFLQQFGNPSYAHLTSSCMMAKRENGGVVDSSNMRVYGVDGLRIVDASVIPLIPAAHISTSVYAMAEKAADVIKASM